MIRILVLLGILTGVHAAEAQTVSLAWGSPDGPAIQSFTQGPVDLYITLRGQSVPLQALQVRIGITNNYPCAFDPDPPTAAWRFDDAGCQAGRVCMTGRAFDPGAPGPAPPGYQSIAFYQFDEWTVRSTAGFIEAYPSAVIPDPGRTYTIARMHFDHSHSGAGDEPASGQCANGDRGMVLHIKEASWLDATGTEHPWAVGQEYVLWNREHLAVVKGKTTHCTQGETAWTMIDDPEWGVPVCDLPVPARSSTWGSVKALYR